MALRVLGAIQPMQRRRVEARASCRRAASSRVSRAAANASSRSRGRARHAARRHHAGLHLADDLLPSLGDRPRPSTRRARRAPARRSSPARCGRSGGTACSERGRHRAVDGVWAALRGDRRWTRSRSRTRPVNPNRDRCHNRHDAKDVLVRMRYGAAPVRLLSSAIDDRLGLRGMRGKEHAFGPGRAACGLPCPSRPSLAPFSTRNRMMSSEPRLAAPISAVSPIELIALTSYAELVTELHRLEQRRGPFVKRLVEHPVHSGGRHQRRRPLERARCSGSAPCFSSSRMTSTIAGERRGEERRLSGEVHPRQRAGRRGRNAAGSAALPSCARSTSRRVPSRTWMRLEQRRAVDAVDERRVVDVHVARLDCGPQRRAAVPVDGLDVGAPARSGTARRRRGCW